MPAKKKATIDRKAVNKKATLEDVVKLQNKLTKKELTITALAFGHCVVRMYDAAKIDIPTEFSPTKESRRLVRALRKQGKDSV